MILSNLSDSARIEGLHPRFKQLFDYVKTHDLSQVAAGRIELEGDELFINVSDATLMEREAQKLEVHEAYIDVHFPLGGDEVVGWRAISTLGAPDATFNHESDFALYTAAPSTYFTVHPGEFFVAYPEDAHAPIIGKGTLRKLIAKVKI